jgi:hypothetical protein
VDRITVYSGEVPRTVDFLQAEQNTMVAGAKLAASVLGTTGVVDGFACTPNSPAALNVLLGGGTVYQVTSLEATTWSSLAADTTDQVVKQGIQLAQQTIALTPPGTAGFSQVFLIEVQYQDSDSGSTVLPYFNAANPNSPFSGPGNTGTAQNTTRKGIAAVQVKAGVAATTGTQVAPTADAGWIGLWLVTLANGQTTITAGNIVQVANAPFLGASYMPKLPNVPSYIQSGAWGAVQDTSVTANTITVAPSPPPVSIGFGTKLTVKIANAVTGATVMQTTLANGTVNTSPVVHGDLTALLANDLVTSQVVELNFDGANWQMPRASASVAANQITASAVGMNQPINCQIQALVSAGALTVTVVGANGAALSAANPMVATFRDATIGNGDPVTRIVTSNPTFTVNSGNTLGGVNGVTMRAWVVLIDNGGTVLVGLINCLSGSLIFPLNESALSTTGAGTGGGSSAGVIYTSVATVTNKAIRIIGFLEWSTALATAGTYNNPPNLVQLFGPGIKKPGDVVQTLYYTTSTSVASNGATKVNLTGFTATPQVTPTSPVNPIRARLIGNGTSGSGVNGSLQMFRGTNATPIGKIAQGGSGVAATTLAFDLYCEAFDSPQSVATQTYGAFLLASAGVTFVWLNASGIGAGGFGFLSLEELQA